MKLTGKTLDVDNSPLMGVNIYPMKDGKFYGVGTSSDYDGKFVLESDDITADQFIKFSFLGYKPIEFNAGKLGASPNKVFKMMEDITSLDEVVITATKPKSSSSKRSRAFGVALISAGVLTTAIIIYKNR